MAAYRSQFKPSDQLAEPYVIAGANVVAAETEDAAREQLATVKRNLAVGLFGRGQTLTDEQADQLLAQGAGQHVNSMLTHTALGTPAQVGDFLEGFAKTADADELIVAFQAPSLEDRLRGIELTASALR